jgi:hypothetical protein
MGKAQGQANSNKQRAKQKPVLAKERSWAMHKMRKEPAGDRKIKMYSMLTKGCTDTSKISKRKKCAVPIRLAE